LKDKAQELEDRIKTAIRQADSAYGVDPRVLKLQGALIFFGKQNFLILQASGT